MRSWYDAVKSFVSKLWIAGAALPVAFRVSWNTAAYCRDSTAPLPPQNPQRGILPLTREVETPLIRPSKAASATR
jgi:hypothetical protein